VSTPVSAALRIFSTPGTITWAKWHEQRGELEELFARMRERHRLEDELEARRRERLRRLTFGLLGRSRLDARNRNPLTSIFRPRHDPEARPR
jgi:hypothetical protein